MKRKNLERLSLAAIAALVLLTASVLPGTASAADGEVTNWRLQALYPSASTSYQDSVMRVKGIIEERTEGRLKIKVYPAGALLKGTQIFDAVSRGTVEMGVTATSYVQNQISLAGIAAGLPFAFRHVWEAAYFYQNEEMGFEQMLRDEAAEHGVYWATDRVYPTEMVVKKPIKSMADFKGLKIRSGGSLQRFLSHTGASANYIPGSEMYTALSTGVVDGAHWGAAQGAASMGLYEIAKYHVKPALTITGTDVFVINQEALDALSDKDAKIVKDTLDEEFWYRTNEYQYKEKLALAKAMKNQSVKINTLPPDVQEKLTAIAQDTWDELGERSDKAAEAVKRARSMLKGLGYLQ